MIRDTFSGRVKDELARRWPADDGALGWELTGLCLGCGSPLPGGGWRWRTESAATARLVVRLVRARYGVAPRLVVDRRGRLGRGNVYELWLEAVPAAADATAGRAADAAAARGSGTSTPPAGHGTRGAPRGEVLPGLPDPAAGQRPLRRQDREAFLRGLFLGSGSLTGPGHGYHAEVVVPAPVASRVAAELRRWGLRPGRARRRGRVGLYLKEAEQIAELLGRLGAHQAVLALENHRVVKGVRNQVNRLVNAETANLRKAVDAGLRQVEAIRRLVDAVGWDGLPASLRPVARARLEHPSASLRDLGQMLEPPLSKSAVGHRIRRLQALAARYAER
ncbi:MAG TPA: DNA-binding protein WhiA [Thermaerobacter sp.]